jgi:hypothetical protein
MEATCDVCGATTSWEQGTAYTADEFRRLVALGFEPDRASVASAVAKSGMAREDYLRHWKGDLVARCTTGWMLCPRCAAGAAPILPGRIGADPSDYVLTETFTVHPVAPAAATPGVGWQPRSAPSAPIPVQRRGAHRRRTVLLTLAVVLVVLGLVTAVVGNTTNGVVYAVLGLVLAGVAIRRFRR